MSLYCLRADCSTSEAGTSPANTDASRFTSTPSRASSCSERESYTLKFLNEETISIVSLLGAKTFDTFPDLKIVVAHGGGAIPYQMGRFRSWNVRKQL